MAASSQNSDDGEISGINVTPLVDVMLVLLIIFMVTAKYIEHEAIPVDLPKAASGGSLTAKTFLITIQKDGSMYVDKKLTDDQELVADVQQAQAEAEKAKSGDVQAVIGADKDSLHGRVIHVLDLLKTHGVTKFAFEIDKP